MKLGVIFPQTEIGSDPIVIRDFAQAAEDLGYDYLLAYDHVVGANPDRPGGWSGRYDYRSMFHEPFVLFSYLAGLTQRLEFVTGILILPQRQTALVAKQAAELDVLSGGRLRLGVAVGWNPVEYQALGCNFHDRGKRIEEQVVVLRELWTKPLVTFRGQYHTIEDAGLNPLPVQRPIPIWFGGYADVVLRRMARLGDGWIASTTRMSLEQAANIIERLRVYLEAEGRKPEDFGIDGRVSIATPPDERNKQLRTWRDWGATHASVVTMDTGLTTPQAHIEALRRFKAETEI